MVAIYTDSILLFNLRLKKRFKMWFEGSFKIIPSEVLIIKTKLQKSAYFKLIIKTLVWCSEILEILSLRQRIQHVIFDILKGWQNEFRVSTVEDGGLFRRRIPYFQIQLSQHF